MDLKKKTVHDFWERASCGEALYLKRFASDSYDSHAQHRYTLEPYIQDFAGFESAKGKKVLEIGVGLGADHERFAEAGAELWGVDLTSRAIEHVRQRLSARALKSNLSVGDAENLSFNDNTFDTVYSWGVLHHTPDTRKAISEVWRVLRPGGVAKIMIYHKWSLVGYMLWVRFALIRLRPWLSLADVYSNHLESPGTKAYTAPEARQMFSAFTKVDIRVFLTHADLLASEAGQTHNGLFLSVARRMWPRHLLRKWAQRHGLFLAIHATK